MRTAWMLTLSLSLAAACGGSQRSAAGEEVDSSGESTRPVRLAPHTDTEGEVHAVSSTEEGDAVAPPPVEPP